MFSDITCLTRDMLADADTDLLVQYLRDHLPFSQRQCDTLRALQQSAENSTELEKQLYLYLARFPRPEWAAEKLIEAFQNQEQTEIKSRIKRRLIPDNPKLGKLFNLINAHI